MAHFARLYALAALVSVAFATSSQVARSDETACVGGVVTSSSTIALGESSLLLETVSCSELSLKSDHPMGFFPPPKPTPSKTSSAAPPPPTPADVCGLLCTDSCSSTGILPPIFEDCEQIYNAVTILNGSISPTFTVPGNSIPQLTFGTCRVFFQNFTPNPITECWTSLANQASAAGTICFPPTQPVQSLGICSGANGAWEIGVTHS